MRLAICRVQRRRVTCARKNRSFTRHTQETTHADTRFAPDPTCRARRGRAGRRMRAAIGGTRPGQRDPHRPHLQQDRSARGLWQADADRLHDGPRLRDRRHDDRRRQEARGDREGRPGQARPRQEPARRGLRRRQGRPRGRAPRRRAWRWRCCRWPRSTRRSCWSSPRWPTRSPATSGTSTSSAPAAIQLAGRDLQRGGARQGRRQHRHAGAGLRVRPRRREGVQGRDQERQDRPRGVPADRPPPTSPPVRSA